MTSQIADRVIYRGEKYELLWGNFLEQFINQKYNLRQNTTATTSNCWRGYVAEYTVESAHLYLTELHVFGMGKPFLEIDGKTPIQIFDKSSRKDRKRGMEPLIYSHWVTYGKIQERLNCTGSLVIGNGYDGEMWFYPHRCKKLFRLSIQNGQPKQVTDFSQEAAELRQSINLEVYPNKEEREFIENFRKKVFNLEQ